MKSDIEAKAIERIRDFFSAPPFSDLLGRMLEMEVDFYIVGGVIRDLVLGRDVKDVDFLVPKGGIEVAKNLAGGLDAAFYPLDEERDTGRVVLRPSGLFVDVASMRGSLEEDMRARDFTVNAVAARLSSWPTISIVDVVDGLRHMHAQRLSAVSEDAFRTDPVRVLRLVRFMAVLGFRPDGRTWAWAKRDVAGLANVSAERVRDELVEIVEAAGLADSLQRLNDLGADVVVLPEMADLKGIPQPPPHFDDVYDHTLSVVRYTERILDVLDGGKPADEPESVMVEIIGEYFPRMIEHLATKMSGGRTVRCCLKLASVAHDWGKPKTLSVSDGEIHFFKHETAGEELARARLRALAFSRAEVDWVAKAVRLHMRIHDIAHAEKITDRAIFRFVRDAGEMLPSLALLNLADHRGTYQDLLDMDRWIARLQLVERILEFYYRRLGAEVPRPILSGKDVMELWGIPPGPKIGRILRAIQEAQAVGEISSRDEAIDWVNRWMQEGD